MRLGVFAAALALALSSWAATTSPVADAAMKGDLAALQSLLRDKADVNARPIAKARRRSISLLCMAAPK